MKSTINKLVEDLRQQRSVIAQDLEKLEKAIRILDGGLGAQRKRRMSVRPRFSMLSRKHTRRGKYNKAKVKKPKATHWTQRPENRKKLAGVLEKANKSRLKKAA